jgi:hypothetical protein
MSAAARGQLLLLQQLLNLGADHGSQAANGFTAIEFARRFGHEYVIAELQNYNPARDRPPPVTPMDLFHLQTYQVLNIFNFLCCISGIFCDVGLAGQEK